MSMFWKDFEMKQQYFHTKNIFLFQCLFIVISFYWNIACKNCSSDESLSGIHCSWSVGLNFLAEKQFLKCRWNWLQGKTRRLINLAWEWGIAHDVEWSLLISMFVKKIRPSPWNESDSSRRRWKKEFLSSSGLEFRPRTSLHQHSQGKPLLWLVKLCKWNSAKENFFKAIETFYVRNYCMKAKFNNCKQKSLKIKNSLSMIIHIY